ncbi:heparinase II/III family protein [uncultured Nocardioides sp.]|uniref:heparinase II/III domain-containing protein n=1 Tax=uncultured Nocardioides sp. TaxID=198441 RepID=UPI00262E9C34|nr:heparinase II/III family protein [uncultured Nocardioides sp.]
MRLSTAVSDLRALGGSAPLRAAYELSKRSGGHTLLFREVPDRGARSRAIGLGNVVPRSNAARDRCLADAAEILATGVRVFGTRVPTGVHAPWNVDPLSGNVWPESTPWWQIDIRSGARLSDVKWVWEAGRHRDLVVLARASVLEPDGPWLNELHAMLRAWVAQCRPERGVHWYSSLELALRAIAWAQVISLLDGELEADVRAQMDHQLVASARHILVELPYTVSSMKNNHLLGDGLGLVVLARMFPDLRGSGQWHRVGDALFHKQLRRHMRSDGSMIEDSLSYHRFVLEMLAVRTLLGSASREVEVALAGAGRHLQVLGALEGDVPQYGDWDEGRVLADSQPAGGVAGSARLALAVTGGSLASASWESDDELAWYVDPPTSDEPGPASAHSNLRRSGGLHVMKAGPWTVWVKSGTGPSHQHADITSAWISKDGQWVTREPGTGTYNGPLVVRNGFRSSSGHPVWCLGSRDQLVPHRAFRWLSTIRPSAAEADVVGSRFVLVVHGAFVADGGGRVARLVHLQSSGVRVVDFVEVDPPSAWVMNVPITDQAIDLGLDLPGAVQSGVSEPFRGWHSRTYGAWEPSQWISCTMVGRAASWSVGVDRGVVTGPEDVVADDATYRIHWSDGSARVQCRVDDETHELVAHDV